MTGILQARHAEINLLGMSSTDNFPGNSRLGPLVKKKTGMKREQPDAAVGGGIPRHYAFMDEIITANIQGMIHGRLVILNGVMNLIHKMYQECS